MSDLNPRIALVASVGLGDGVMALLVANNLARNGFEVTFYSDPINQLSSWLPQLKTCPYPAPEDIYSEFASYDVVLADGISILAKPYFSKDDFSELARKYIYLSLGNLDNALRFDHTERMRATMSPGKFAKCQYLASCSGEIRFQDGTRTTTMVKNAVMFCQNMLKLDNVSSDTGLTPPPELGLTRHKFAKRILLHPFSSSEQKNWPLRGFFQVARKLKKNGWEPAFVVAPAEQSSLQKMIKGEIDAPLFPTIADLTAFVYESRAIISNNSGTVNLASSLGLPAVSITYRGENHRWRPDWSPGKVVVPRMKFRLGKKRVWKPFVSTNMVYRAFTQLVAKVKVSHG